MAALDSLYCIEPFNEHRDNQLIKEELQIDIEAFVQNQTTSLQWLEQQLLGSTDSRSTQAANTRLTPAMIVDDIEDYLDWGATGLVDFGAELRGTSDQDPAAYHHQHNSHPVLLPNKAGSDGDAVSTHTDCSTCSSRDVTPPPLSITAPMMDSPPMPLDSAPHTVAAAAAAHHTRLIRAASIARYREKRLRRTFDKTIRYQTRKNYAETRPRIKGRFARKDELAAMAAEGLL